MSEEEEEEIIMSFTDTQKRILQNIVYIPSTCSLIGSIMVIYVLVVDKKLDVTNSFRRIMIGLSSIDALSFVGFLIFANWGVPQETSTSSSSSTIGARGTIFTCNMLGFFSNLLFGAQIYSASLCFYFLCIVKYQWNPQQFAITIEPFIHAYAIFWPVTTGLYAIKQGYINPIDSIPGWCWLHDYPNGCSTNDNVQCLRGENYNFTSQVVGSGGTIFAFVFMVVSMILLIQSVYNTEQKLQRYNVTGNNNYNNYKLTIQVGKQGLSYIGAFMIVCVPVIILLCIDIKKTPMNQEIYFLLCFMAKLFILLQGLFNACILFQTRMIELTQPGRALQSLAPLLTPTTTTTSSSSSATTSFFFHSTNNNNKNNNDHNNGLSRILISAEETTGLDQETTTTSTENFQGFEAPSIALYPLNNSNDKEQKS